MTTMDYLAVFGFSVVVNVIIGGAMGLLMIRAIRKDGDS